MKKDLWLARLWSHSTLRRRAMLLQQNHAHSQQSQHAKQEEKNRGNVHVLHDEPNDVSIASHRTRGMREKRGRRLSSCRVCNSCAHTQRRKRSVLARQSKGHKRASVMSAVCLTGANVSYSASTASTAVAASQLWCDVPHAESAARAALIAVEAAVRAEAEREVRHVQECVGMDEVQVEDAQTASHDAYTACPSLHPRNDCRMNEHKGTHLSCPMKEELDWIKVTEDGAEGYADEVHRHDAFHEFSWEDEVEDVMRTSHGDEAAVMAAVQEAADEEHAHAQRASCHRMCAAWTPPPAMMMRPRQTRAMWLPTLHETTRDSTASLGDVVADEAHTTQTPREPLLPMPLSTHEAIMNECEGVCAAEEKPHTTHIDVDEKSPTPSPTQDESYMDWARSCYRCDEDGYEDEEDYIDEPFMPKQPLHHEEETVPPPPPLLSSLRSLRAADEKRTGRCTEHAEADAEQESDALLGEDVLTADEDEDEDEETGWGDVFMAEHTGDAGTDVWERFGCDAMKLDDGGNVIVDDAAAITPPCTAPTFALDGLLRWGSCMKPRMKVTYYGHSRSCKA